jgi:hypothetical protein
MNLKATEAWADFLSAHLGRIERNTSWAVHLRSTATRDSQSNKTGALAGTPKALAHSLPLPASFFTRASNGVRGGRERERRPAGQKERRRSRACSSTGGVHLRVSAPPSSGSVAVPLAGAPSRRAEELGVPVSDSDDIGSGERWAQGETFGCRAA